MKVFISHAMDDAPLAGLIAKELQSAGFQVWTPAELFPGDNWAKAMGEALDHSQAMVVLLTPSWIASPYAKNEVTYALGKETYKDRVIPVFASSPQHLSRDNIPWILKSFPSIDLDKMGAKKGLAKLSKVLSAAA